MSTGIAASTASDEQIASAEAMVAKVMAAHGVVPAFSVAEYRDPELGGSPRTLLRVHLRTEPGGDYYDLVGGLLVALREAGLAEPHAPLITHVVPEW